MKKFFVYLLIQIKRVVKIFPTILVTTLLLCGCVGAMAFFAMEKDGADERFMKVQVGLVGDVDSYMGVNLTSLINFLSSKFGMEFTQMTEADAREALRTGKLSTYVLIPDGLVHSIASGANDLSVTYVAADGQKGISSTIMDEVANSVSDLITYSESAIYGMQDFLLEQGRDEEFWDATDALNFAYIGILTNLYAMCDLEITGLYDRVSAAGYYLCSIWIVFMMLCGINCSHLFTKKNMELPKLLAARGQNVASQVLGEYLAYFVLMLLCVCIVSGATGALIRLEYIAVPEWEGFGWGMLLRFFLRMIPVAAVICAMQFLIYEAVSGIVGSILMQFVGTIVLGYLCGCFYPLNFFPEGMQRVGALLPIGAAMRYAGGCLTERFAGVEFGMILGYLVLFLGLSIAVRGRKVAL